MKKLFLLAILLFQVTFVFGQERGYKKTNWSSYRSFPCFPNLYISLRCVGYEPLVKKYEYQFRLKNTSSQTVHFNLDVRIKKSNEEILAGRFSIRSGEEKAHESSYANAVSEPNAEGFFASTVSGYMENDKDDWTIPTYSCINGVKTCVQNCKAKEPIKSNNSNSQNNNITNSNTNTTSPANNSNTPIAPQNDLTEYNRSKADLERQMNEKNADGQQKSQNYTTAMNAGILAYNSGNYAEAKRQFSIALNNCNTEDARLKAKDYYDKTINAEKSQTKIKLIGDLSQTIISGIQQQKEWAAEQKRIKAERLKQIDIENIKAAEAAINSLTDPKIFEGYCNFIVSSTEALGFKFEKLSEYQITITSKKIKIFFNNNLIVDVNQFYSTSKPATMFNNITFRTTNSIDGNLIKNSDLFDFLKQLDYFDYEGHKNYYMIENEGEYVYDFKLFGLEKTEAFANIYRNGYTNPNYNGANNYIKKIEENVQKKLSNSDVSARELIENGDAYRNGKGVEKNIYKALEFYNKAKEQGDNEATLTIANTYSSELKNYGKAKELLEQYISFEVSTNIKGAKLSLRDVYNNLGDFNKAISIGKEVFSLDEIDFTKAKNNNEKYVAKIQIGFSSKSIAQCYVNIGDANEAIKWYEIAASYDFYSAITLAQIYLYGSANQYSNAIQLGSKLKFKKSKKLVVEWANKACQLANKDINTYGDTTEKKKELEKSAKWCCDFVQKNILKN